MIIYNINGLFSAIGFTNGSVRIVDGLTLKEEGRGDGLAVFNHCHDCVTNIKFSHDSSYLATSVSKLSTPVVFAATCNTFSIPTHTRVEILYC